MHAWRMFQMFSSFLPRLFHLWLAHPAVGVTGAVLECMPCDQKDMTIMADTARKRLTGEMGRVLLLSMEGSSEQWHMLSGQWCVPSQQLRRGSPVKGVVGTTGAGEEGMNQLAQLPRLENL